MRNNGDIPQQATQKALGRYRLLQRIGRGGMGDVWLAEDPRLHRQVAIKTLPSHNQDDQEYLLRFEREARAAAALNHPHILPVHDYGDQQQADGQSITYLVMPYIAGGSLADRIITYDKRFMPIQEALWYLSQAAEAIDYAHIQGVIHRDIKPGNMLLRSDNWLLLADFGIARVLADAQHLTSTGVGFGTPEYMAPEQARGKAEPASDTYSLAIIAYQLLTGQLPFHAETSYGTTIQHLTMPPPPPRQFNPSLPLASEQVLLWGLAKAPAERPASAQAFVAELQQAIQHTQHTPLAPTPAYMPAATPPTQPFAANIPTAMSIKGPITQNEEQQTKRIASKEAVMTRRQLLIGGTTVAIAGGGIAAWAFATHTSPPPTSANHKTRVTPTATDPNAPSMTLTGHNRPVRSLAWSPTQNILASSGSGSDGQVLLWDIDASYQQKLAAPTPKNKQAFDTTANGILISWSPDGQLLAIANAGSANSANLNESTLSVYLGDLTNPAPGYITKPTITPQLTETFAWLNTRYIITAFTSIFQQGIIQVGVWDSQQPQKTFMPAQLPGYLSENAISTVGLSYAKALTVERNDAGSYLALATAQGLRVGQLSITGASVKWQQHGPLRSFGMNALATEVDGTAWSPLGSAIYAYTNNDLHPLVGAWAVNDSQPEPQLFGDPHSPVNITTIARAPASSQPLLAAGNLNGTIYLWNTSASTLVARTLQGPKAEVTALGWSHDGQWLAASFADTNDSILIWKM